MLSSSPSKIHEPRVTGVSPRPTDQRERQKTAKHEPPVSLWVPRTVSGIVASAFAVGAANHHGHRRSA
jgi:hypothetical protein